MNGDWWMHRVQPGMRNKPKVRLARLPGSREHMSWILSWAQRSFNYSSRPSKRRIRREIGRLKEARRK